MKATILLAVVFFCEGLCVAQSQIVQPDSEKDGALEKMAKQLEVRFALSALPPHLRDAATVYVLDPQAGYVLDTSGANGFSCIVERTEWARVDFRSDIYTALCYDEEESKNQLRVYMDTASMRAKGMSPDQVKSAIAARFSEGTYAAPKRAGLSYMLAPIMRTYPSPDVSDRTLNTWSMPHFMIYAPNVTDKDIGGARPPSQFPFIFEQGPQGYMIFMLGQQEAQKLVSDSKNLLSDLCAYRSVLCLGRAGGHE